MKLKDIYRDVYSQLSLQGNEHNISALDIIKAINESIKLIRIEYVNNDLGQFFVEEERITNFTQDNLYPFLKFGTLTIPILSEVPLEIAVLASNVKITDNEILNQVQTFSEGDVAEYDGILYEAIRDITNENTFGETFDSTDLRMYYPNNGLKYREGDIVFNGNDDRFYKVTTDFVASGGTEELEEVVWRKIGNANKISTHYPLKDLRNIVLHDDEKQAFSVVNNKIYVNTVVSELSISYVPAWQDVNDLEATIEIPDGMLSQVVERSRVKLLNKLTQRVVQSDE